MQKSMLDTFLPSPDISRSRSFCIQKKGEPTFLIILASAFIVIFTASAVALFTWSSRFGFGKQHQEYDHTPFRISLANKELEQEGGLIACLVIASFLLGLCCVVVAGGLYVNKLGMAKVGGWLSAGLLLTVPCMPAISTTLRGSTDWAFVPEDFKVDQLTRDKTAECHCVLFVGIVVLTPIVYDVGATIFNILGNSVVTLVKLLGRSKGHFSAKAGNTIEIVARSTPLDLSAEYWMCEDNRTVTNAGCQLKRGEVFQGKLYGVDLLELADGRGNVRLEGPGDAGVRKLLPQQLSEYVMTEYDTKNLDISMVGGWLDLKFGDADAGEAGWVDISVESVHPFKYKKEGSGPACRMMLVHGSAETPQVHLRYYELTKISSILFKSIRDPSLIFLLPTFAYHLLHFFGKLVPLGIRQGGIYGLAITYMPFINSGAMSYIMMGFFATFLTGVSEGWGNIVRLYSAIALAFCILPIMPIAFLGMISFAWFFLEIEFLLALMTRVAFPQPFDQIAVMVKSMREFLSDARDQMNDEPEDCCCKLTVLILTPVFAIISTMSFSCFPLAAKFANMVGIKHEESPLGNLSSCLAIFSLVMLKVIEWQFVVNATMLLFFMDVSYFDAIPLAYLARHWRCNACLMEQSVSHTAELGILAWAQFYSMF